MKAILSFITVAFLLMLCSCQQLSTPDKSTMTPSSQPKHNGIVCFTFDDARYKEWLPVLPLFKKYNAHATFFFHGEITAEAADAMKALIAEGHSVGLHTLTHKDAAPDLPENYVETQIRPQLDACKKNGIAIRHFAYPNNARTQETDVLLTRECGFKRLRAGVPKHTASGLTIAQDPRGFIPYEDIPQTQVMTGYGIGDYYHTTQQELDEALEYAAKTGTLLVFFSHGISNKPLKIDMSISTLESCLKKAQELNLAVVSFDQLPE